MGLTVESSAGKLHQVTQRVGVDRRTGEIVERPAVQFRDGGDRMTPDPGWNYNPGAGGAGGGTLPPLVIPPPITPPDPKLNPSDWRALKLPGTVQASAAGGAVKRRIEKAEYLATLTAAGAKPLPVTRPDGKKDVELRRVSRPGELKEAVIGERFVDHIFNHPDDRRRADFAEFVIPALRDPGEVWGRWEEIDGRTVWHEFSLAVFPGANNTVVVLREMPKLGMFAWTVRPVSRSRAEKEINKQRRGKLLYRKPGTGGT